MFLQFYRNFTPQVLKEFYEEDSQLKERELSLVSGREALRSANGKYSAMSNKKHELLERPLGKLPFGEMMENFKDTFEKVFEQEKLNHGNKFYLSTIWLVQIATKRLYDTLFTFTFMKDTTKDIKYSSSERTKKLMK